LLYSCFSLRYRGVCGSDLDRSWAVIGSIGSHESVIKRVTIEAIANGIHRTVFQAPPFGLILVLNCPYQIDMRPLL
jgi:hypothetical protein